MLKKLKQKFQPGKMRKVIGTIASGHAVTSHFVRRNIVTIGLFLWLMLSMITVRYDCITSMDTINKRQSRLDSVRSAKQDERAHYMTQTREITIRSKVDSLGMGLTIQNQPPYMISHGNK